MQSTIDAEFIYHGISFDERMVIFRLFHDDQDLESGVEHSFWEVVTERHLQ